VDWRGVLESALTDPGLAGHRRRLARLLGVSEASLASLPVGYWPSFTNQAGAGEPESWAIPERDGTGRLVGIGTRDPAHVSFQEPRSQEEPDEHHRERRDEDRRPPPAGRPSLRGGGVCDGVHPSG
jgi:hypothetical protein